MPSKIMKRMIGLLMMMGIVLGVVNVEITTVP